MLDGRVTDRKEDSYGRETTFLLPILFFLLMRWAALLHRSLMAM
jgi:hypothetical protein